MKLRLGTRGSALAVGQSSLVAEQLRGLGHDVELIRVKTDGDVATGSLTNLGSLGVFAAALRQSLLDGGCDFAVHSLKDLPTGEVPGLTIAAVPTRADYRDALCARDGLSLADLPSGSSVGTGSPRRVAQLRRIRPDLRYVDIRGNVGTRLARVGEGDLDAVVLAAAGLARLNLLEHVTDYLDLLPAPGQGALALECRVADAELIQVLQELEQPSVRAAVDAERAVLAGLGGGCAAPIAALGEGGSLRAAVFALDGRASVEVEVPMGPDAASHAVGDLLNRGAAGVAELDATRGSRLGELHDETSLWGSPNTLAGRRVFVPRAEGELSNQLRAAGAEVVSEPVVDRVMLRPMVSFEGVSWIVLASPAAVGPFLDLGLRPTPDTKLAALGKATANELRKAGFEVDFVPDSGVATAAAFVVAFPAGSGRIVLPGSALTSGVLASGLSAKGYEVESVSTYTVETKKSLSPQVVAEYAAGHFDAVVITAGSVARAVDELLGWVPGTKVVAFGPPSAQALIGLGVAPDAVAATQDSAGLIAAIAGES